jgi:iron complex transport system substrate-binding protein
MKKYLPFVALACIGLSIVGARHGCAQSPVQTICDRAGRTVSLPSAIQKVVITCYGGASHEISILGGSDKIIAQPSIERFPQLMKMYPRFAQVPDAGSFNNVNIEQVMALKPDVVFAPIISEQAVHRLEETKIPVVVVAVGRTDIAGLLEEFKMIGTIFGETEKSAELINYWKERLSLVKDRLAAIPEAQRKKVLYTSSAIPFRTEGGSWWGQHFITASGGVNVAGDIQHGAQVTAEQLLVWDPDVIIVTTNSNNPALADTILNSSQLKIAKAVRSHAVYQCPVGAFWWDRPSPEAILGILWLSKVLYPDAMADVDIGKETRRFFTKFYNYELSESEFESFLKPGGDELKRRINVLR